MADLQWHELEFTKASINFYKRERTGEGNDKKLGF